MANKAPNVFTQEHEKKYQSLVASFDELSDDELQELLLLKKSKAAYSKFKEEQKEEVKSSLKDLGYSVVDLFSKAEVKAAAIHFKLIEGSTSVTNQTVNGEKGDVVASHKVGERKQNYTKGRIYKPTSEKNKQPYPSADKWSPLLMEYAQSPKSFLAICNEEGKKYFTEDEKGIAELAKIVELTQNAKRKLDLKAKA